MAQLKRQIHLLKESYVASKSLESEDVISFTRAELAPTSGEKLNPIILDVSMTHPNFQQFLVRRVLVDSGASSNILYYQCFRDMGLGEEMLRPTSMKLEGFTTHKVMTKGIMVLNVTLGAGLVSRTEQVEFYVVDVQSIYNSILGMPAQSAFDVVISVPHQRVKFPTSGGIGVELRNPSGVLNYLIRCKKANPELELTPTLVIMIDEVRNTSASIEIHKGNIDHCRPQEYEEVVIHPQFPDQKIKVGRV